MTTRLEFIIIGPSRARQIVSLVLVCIGQGFADIGRSIAHKGVSVYTNGVSFDFVEVNDEEN